MLVAKRSRRNHGPTSGLFLRQENAIDIDYERMPRPECKSKKCELDCCNGNKEEVRDASYVMECRKAAVDGYFQAGGHSNGQFVMCLIIARGLKKTRLQPSKSRRFDSRPRLQEGRCIWCRTLEVAEKDAKHNYHPRRCPNYEDGIKWLQTHPVRVAKKEWEYSLPSYDHKFAPYVVSRTFFQSFYCIASTERLIRLKQISASTNPNKWRQKSGAGGKNKLDHKIREKFFEFLGRVPKKRVVSSSGELERVMFQEGVTKEALWYEFCSVEDPSFHGQCVRVGHKLTYTTTHKNFITPEDAVYENDLAKGKIYPVIRYHMALELIKAYSEENHVLFQKIPPAQRRKRKRSELDELMLVDDDNMDIELLAV